MTRKACKAGQRCRRTKCKQCENIRKAMFADRVAGLAELTALPLYLLTVRVIGSRLVGHRRFARSFRRKWGRRCQCGGFWKLETGSTFRDHAHFLVASEWEITSPTVQSLYPRLPLDVNTVRIASPADVRNVASYLAKSRPSRADDVDSGGGGGKSSSPSPNSNGSLSPHNSGFFGIWHGNARGSLARHVRRNCAGKGNGKTLQI